MDRNRQIIVAGGRSTLEEGGKEDVRTHVSTHVA